MSLQELLPVAVDFLLRLATSTVFLLVLFIGFCFFAGLPKLRKRARGSLVHRNLSERLEGQAKYLPPDAPRGPADQLRTPELLEQAKPQ